MALPIPIDQNKKEVFYETTTNSLVGNTAVQFIFPPLDTYNSNGQTIEPYKNRPDDKLVNADVAYLKLKHFRDTNQDAGFNDGEFGNTNVGGAFFAIEDADYYYKYTGTSSNITAPSLQRSTNNPTVAESIKLPSGSTGATFENKSLGMLTQNVSRFEDVEVDGLNEGELPTGQLMTAIRLEDFSAEDVTYRCFDQATISTTRTSITGASSITGQATQTHFGGIAAEFIDENSNEYVVHKTDPADGSFVDSSSYVSAVEIVNIERPLDDLRYGDEEDDLPFQFTGASYYFDDEEIDLNVAGNPPAIDIDVWGGDCFLGLHTFKITDSAYSLTDPEKDVDGSVASGSAQTQTDKWEYYFKKSLTTGTEDVSRPFPLKGVSQTITVLMESEVNPEYLERPQHNDYNYDVTAASSTSNLPLPVVDDAGQIRSKFKYYFNTDYAKQNSQKIFFPYKSFDRNQTKFGARLINSDQKIYNTDIEGFDRFRALNYYDMDESHGVITGVIESGDKIFVTQEHAFSYAPVNAQIIESADGGNLAVQSNVLFGKIQKIDTSYGTQDSQTIKVDGNTIFFVDKLRGEVCMWDGQSLKLVSRLGMEKYFNEGLALDPNLAAWYDNKRKEYAVYFMGSDAAVFNAEGGAWSQRLPESTDITTYGGARIGSTMMLIGADATETMYSGELYSSSASIGSWWGSVFTPTLKYYVNIEPDIVKTFDGFTVVSDRIVDPQSFVVIQSDGTSSTADLSSAVINDSEGTFRLKNLRDASGARSRGVYGELEIDFITTAKSGTTSVLCKYRPSFKPL